MNPFASVTRWVFIFLLCFFVTSCGNSDGRYSATTDGGGGAPQTGTLRIESVLAKAVPSAVTQLRISGFGGNDKVVFGPVTVAKAALIVLEDVPIAVERVQIEYLVKDRIVGIGTSPVAISQGQVTSLIDPDFLSLEEELLSLTLSPLNASIPRGISQQFTVTGTFSDQSQVDLSTVVVWSSSNPAVAIVSETGLAQGLVTGSTTLTATLSGVVGSATLNVTDATLSTIAISPLSPSIADGTTQAFTVTGNFSDGSSRSLTGQATLSSSNTAAATIDSATGVATAVDPGQSTITASFQGVTASTTLTVTTATLTSIAVTPAAGNLPSGLVQQYTARGTFSDGTQQDLSSTVVWSSSVPTTATVNSSGLARAGSPGVTAITATLLGVAGQTSLTVTEATLSSLVIAPLTPSIVDGTTQAFTVTGVYSDGSSRSLTGQATLSSSNPAAATIDSSTGIATGVDPGQSTITASFQGATASTVLTVTRPAITSIAIDPPIALSAPGATRQYRAIATLSNASTVDVTDEVTWSSDSTDVAIANDNVGTNKIGRAVVATGAATNQTATITVTLGTVTPANSTLTINLFVYVTESTSDTVRTFSPISGALGASVAITSGVPTGPLCIAVHPSGRYAYIGSSQGPVHSFRIDSSTGNLTQVGGSVFGGVSGRRAAIVVHPNGRSAYVANFDDGTVTTFPVDSATGALSEGTSIAAGQLPSDVTIDRGGRFVYVSNRSANTVSAYTIDASSGALTTVPGTPFPVGSEPGALETDGSGNFLYVSSLGSNSIDLYNIDSMTGALSALVASANAEGDGHGLVVDAASRFLYSASRPDLAKPFAINSSDGILSAGTAVPVDSVGPLSIAIDPSGRYIYTANFQGNNVSVFTAEDGALTRKAPATTSGWATSVVTTP